MLLEVGGNSSKEFVSADPCHQLLQNRGSFGIGDAIEVDLDILEVVDGRNNWVGGGELILAIGPVLFQSCKGGPGLFPLASLGRCQGGDVFGKALV